jgi:hypothetical protein
MLIVLGFMEHVLSQIFTACLRQWSPNEIFKFSQQQVFKIAIFRNVMPCNLVHRYHYPEDGGSRFLQKF